jgi:2-desacetyl-2-hydroxyethyl bacteriochlorophyllide A dehydrogenase
MTTVPGSAHLGPNVPATRIVFPEPGRVEVEQIEVSLADPGPQEVVVKSLRSVISPGTELAHYRGDALAGVLPHAHRRGDPFYPGYAMVGTILAAGQESTVPVGTNVLAHTRHQSVARFDLRERVCVPLPTGLALDVAPFARLAQVGGVSLQLAEARPGDKIAVIGLGPVGNLVAQLAQGSGFRVVGVERSAGRRALAEACGLKSAVSPDDAHDAFGPDGAKLVLECSGSASAVVLATEICARHGEVMTVGAPWRAETEVPASSVVAQVFERFLSLRSGWEWQVPLYGDRSVAGCTNWVLDQLAEGSLTTAPLVSAKVSPDQAGWAYNLLDTEPDRYFTILLDWETEGLLDWETEA